MKIGSLIEEYISYRQSLGEKFKTNARVLRAFSKYVKPEKDVKDIMADECDEYLLGKDKTVTAQWFGKHTALKGFFQWAIVRGYIELIPLTVEIPRRPEHIRPYIYSNTELKKLFDSALTYQKNHSSTYPECVREILILTYVLGLRIHETLGLKLNDLNLKENLVTINDSKFYKSRVESFNETVKKEIERYLKWRRHQRMSQSADSYLFLNRSGKPMNVDSFHDIFTRVRTKAGISRNDGSTYQPRIHDLRHTFAVNRLIAWYDAGENVQIMLPVLSTYMGHTHLAHTSVYLTMTDRLLDCANTRFESYIEGGDKL